MNTLKSWTSKLSRNKTEGIGAVVENPEDFDILLGRGKTSFNHVGNRRFRVFIEIHLQRYMDAQSRMEKTLVVNSVVEAIQDGGGRFLKQDTKTKKWHKVSAKMAREKVGHALRDGVGMQIKAAKNAGQQGNGSGKEQLVCGGRAPAPRRLSGIATYKARRASGTPGPSVFQEIGKNNTFSKSCEALIERSDPPKNSMLQSAQQLVEEIRNGTFDDVGEEEKLGIGGSSELCFKNFSIGKRNMPDTLRSPQKKCEGIHEDSGIKISQATPEDPLCFRKKRLDPRYRHGDTFKIFDGGSSEFSVTSETTTDKWYDIGSGMFSMNTVDSSLFDVDDEDDAATGDTKTDDIRTQELMGQVDKVLTEMVEMDAQKKKGGSDLFSWKRNKLKSSHKSISIDLELSEDFSTMSLDTRVSEEFGLRSEEMTRVGGGMLKSEEFFKSDEFSLDSSKRNVNSTEFQLKADKLTSEIRHSSKAKIIQPKGQMHTVDEGAVLDNYEIKRIDDKHIRRNLDSEGIEEEKHALTPQPGEKPKLESGIS